MDQTLIDNNAIVRLNPKPEDLFIMPGRLPKLRHILDLGYVVVVFTNQKWLSDKKRLSTFEKLKRAVELLQVPLLLLAATGEDQFRKRISGMWEEAQ